MSHFFLFQFNFIDLPKINQMKQAPRWKFAIMVWIAIYPSITIVSLLLSPILLKLPIPLRTLILTLILVPLMVFIIMPFLQKILAKWLFK